MDKDIDGVLIVVESESDETLKIFEGKNIKFAKVGASAWLARNVRYSEIEVINPKYNFMIQLSAELHAIRKSKEPESEPNPNTVLIDSDGRLREFYLDDYADYLLLPKEND